MLNRKGPATLTADLVSRTRRPLTLARPKFGMAAVPPVDPHADARARLIEAARDEIRYHLPDAIRVPHPDEPREPWELRRRLTR